MIEITLFGVQATIDSTGEWYCINHLVATLLKAHQAIYRPPAYSPKSYQQLVAEDVVRRYGAKIISAIEPDAYVVGRVY